MDLTEAVSDKATLQRYGIFTDCIKIREQSTNKKIKKYADAVISHWKELFEMEEQPPSQRGLDVYMDDMVPAELDERESQVFDDAMMKLRGRNVSKEIFEMLRMLDRERRGVITTMLFKTTMMGSKWHLSMSETSAIAKYLAGTARIIDYGAFAELCKEKLNDNKGQDQQARLDRHLKLFRRVSLTGKAIDPEMVAKRWGKMNEMAERAKIKQKEREDERRKKANDRSGHKKRIKEIEAERIKQRTERLALSHMSYRDQAKMAVEKRNKRDEEERFKKFQALKKANEVKYDKRRQSPKGSFIGSPMGSPKVKSPKKGSLTAAAVAMEGVEGDAISSSSSSSFSFSPGQVKKEQLGDAGKELLFDGTIGTFGPPGVKKPFAGDGFGGLTSSLSKASLMLRPKFETWEKHINAEGRIFFHNPAKKKSSWNLPPCSILIDCTEDEVVGEGGIDVPFQLPLGPIADGGAARQDGDPDAAQSRMEEEDPLRSIFVSHPNWDTESAAPVFDELRRIGMASLDPTEEEEKNEHQLEIDLDRKLHDHYAKQGMFPQEIKYHELRSGMLDVEERSDERSDEWSDGKRPSPSRPRQASSTSPEKRVSPPRRARTSASSKFTRKRQQEEQQRIENDEAEMSGRMKLERKNSHMKLEERRQAVRAKKKGGGRGGGRGGGMTVSERRKKREQSSSGSPGGKRRQRKNNRRKDDEKAATADIGKKRVII